MPVVIQLFFRLGLVPDIHKGRYLFALCVFLQLDDTLDPSQLVPFAFHVGDKYHIGSGICKNLVVFLLSQPIDKFFG